MTQIGWRSLVDQFREALVIFSVAALCGFLQGTHKKWIIGMILAITAETIQSDVDQFASSSAGFGEARAFDCARGFRVAPTIVVLIYSCYSFNYLLGNLCIGDLARMSGRTGETALDQACVEAEYLELSTANDIADRRYPHACHDFTQTILNDMEVARFGLLWSEILKVSLSC